MRSIFNDQKRKWYVTSFGFTLCSKYFFLIIQIVNFGCIQIKAIDNSRLFIAWYSLWAKIPKSAI